MTGPGAFADLVPEDADIADAALPIIQPIESGGAPNRATVVSPKGAVGIGQVMPDTARQYGYDPAKLTDPAYNAQVSRTILADLADRYKGAPDRMSAIWAGYNGGPGRGDALAATGDPSVLPKETQDYILKANKQITDGAFSDLVPEEPSLPKTGGAFDDLIPAQKPAGDPFADLVPPPAPSKLPHPEQPEDSWLTTLKKTAENIPAAVTAGAGQALTGVSEFMKMLDKGDVDRWNALHPDQPISTLPTLDTRAQQGRDITQENSKVLAANEPNVEPGSAKGIVGESITSVAQMAPAAFASLITKSSGPLLAAFGAQSYGQQYDRSIQMGRTPEQARVDAGFSAAAATVPAEMPISAILKPGGKILSRIGKAAFGGAAANTITTALQKAYDAGILDVKMTWAEALDAMKQSAEVGGLIGGLFGIVGHGAAGKEKAEAPAAEKIEPTAASTTPPPEPGAPGPSAPPGPSGAPAQVLPQDRGVQPGPLNPDGTPVSAGGQAIATPGGKRIAGRRGEMAGTETLIPGQGSAEKLEPVMQPPAGTPQEVLDTVHDPETWVQTGWKDKAGNILPLDDPRARGQAPDPKVVAAQEALRTNIDPETGKKPKGNAALREFRQRMQAVIDGTENADIVSVEPNPRETNERNVQPLSQSSGAGAEVLPEMQGGVRQEMAENAQNDAGSEGKGSGAGVRERLSPTRENTARAVQNSRMPPEGANAPPGLQKTTSGRVDLQGAPSGTSRNRGAEEGGGIQPALQDVGRKGAEPGLAGSESGTVEKPKVPATKFDPAAYLDEARAAKAAGKGAIAPAALAKRIGTTTARAAKVLKALESAAPDEHFDDALARVRAARAPLPKSEHLGQAIRALGGIKLKDNAGNYLAGGPEIRDILDKNPGLLNNKTGLAPDALREALSEKGWFSGANDTETTGLDDLHDLLGRHVKGEKIYHPTSEAANELHARQMLDEELGRAGVSANDSEGVAARKLADFRKEWGDALADRHEDMVETHDLDGLDESDRKVLHDDYEYEPGSDIGEEHEASEGASGRSYESEDFPGWESEDRASSEAPGSRGGLPEGFEDLIPEKAPEPAPAKPKSGGAEQGTVGMKLAASQKVLTATGRETSPFPKIATDTNRKAVNTVKAVDRWLMQNALDEAKARGDDFNARVFEQNLAKPSQADKDSAEMYLFDKDAVQPVRKSILKPLTSEAVEKPSDYGAKNTVFTADAAQKARDLIRNKLKTQMNSGIDPEMVHAGITLAGFHIEAGARKFADFAKAMLGDLGEEARPFLKMWYNAVRDYPGFDAKGMSEAAELTPEVIASAGKSEAVSPDVFDRSASPEQDRRGNQAEDQPGETPVSDEAGKAARGDGENGNRPVEGRDAEEGGGGADERGPVPVGERGDRGIRAGESELSGHAAGPGERAGGGDYGDEGIQPERIPAETVDRAATESAHVEEDPPQQSEPSVDAPKASAELERALPTLFPEQRDDVAFAERRFSEPEGHGVLFTNGTGTGKTFTGGGIIKRAVDAGKDNILVVAPTQGILDHWLEAAEKLGVPLKVLDDTTSNGKKGPVATTYANFQQNKTLADRDWDHVIADESHTLMSDQNGSTTKALEALRAFTNHPKGYRDRARMQLRQYADPLDEMVERRRTLEKMKMPVGDLPAKIDAAYADLEERMKPVIEKIKGQPRTKVTFLSATPFAYDKNVDYAEGYLFNYPAEDTRGGYNSGSPHDRFFMQHFGYRMKYNKLTKPEAAVQNDVMERQFHEWLRQQKVLSGRVLTVDKDYDRKFMLVNDGVGKKIDQALDWLDKARETDKVASELGTAIRRRFDYLARMRLLEAIKATHAVPVIKKHMAMGRKVVVFHDFNEGGGFNPFEFSPDMGRGIQAPASEIRAAYDRFVQANPYVEQLGADMARMRNPIETLQRAFPDALIYNGTVSKKVRAEAKTKFNEDGGRHNLIVVQSAAGQAGISLHDTTGKHQRVLINLGMPGRPVAAIQIEGRTYRIGQASDAIFRYMNTGTNWERHTFASRLAERAGTAENLALGDRARTLRQSFIDAFNDSAAYPPSAEDGRGGKEIDRALYSSQSEFQRAKSFYYAQGKKKSGRANREGVDYYATPEPIGYKMVEWAGIRPGDKVLEPSAGHGAIARFFPDTSDRTLVEPSAELATRAILSSPGADVKQHRFEDLHIVNKYDAIVMNPPFGAGGSTAVAHIAKAATHLRDGGRIVALIPEGPAADKKFAAFMESDAAKGLYQVGNVRLPPSTFERAGTKINSRVVILERQNTEAGRAKLGDVSRDFSSAENNEELFNRIEHSTVPDRVPVGAPEERPGPALTSARNGALTEPGKAPAAAQEAGSFKLDQTLHSKTGKPVFVATLRDRVDRDAYYAANSLAKQFGGYYSAFRGRGAVPGFQFKTEEARAAFVSAHDAKQSFSRTDAAGPGDLRAIGAYTPEFDAQRAEVQATLQKRLNALGLKDVALKVPDWLRAARPDEPKVKTSGFKASGVYDPFARAIAVALENEHGDLQTLNHETIHAFRDLGVIGDKEWAILERKAPAWVKKYKVEETYKGEAPEKILEEGIAHAFPDWVDGKLGNSGNIIQRIFRRIANFIEATRNALSGLGFKSHDDVFRAIDSGEVGQRYAQNRLAKRPEPSFAKDGGFDFEEGDAVDGRGKRVDQFVAEGGSRSAKQLAAAREAAGHGKIAPKKEQKAPGGLFGDQPAPDDKQGQLFARKGKEPDEEDRKRSLMGKIDKATVDYSVALTKKVSDAVDRIMPNTAKSALADLKEWSRPSIDAVKMATVPMANGTPETRAAAKDFANGMREARVIGARQDDYLNKKFTPEQRARMWNAADEESVALQEGRSTEGIGLSRLSPEERKAVEAFQAESNATLQAARDVGMFKGEGLPSYVPRMVVAVGADGKAARLGYGGDGVHGLDAIGRNLKTTTSSLKQRKHLTREQTEEAARALDPNAVVVRDIRTLPLAMARLREAIAGRKLINTIREMGNAAGEQTISEGSEPEAGNGHTWFTLDHPAFKTYKIEVLHDENGNALFEKVPIYVRGDFEGPLRAVLTKPSNAIVKTLMNLKGKTMSVIMYSPMMHNAVIWGKALPAAPLKLITPWYRGADGSLRPGLQLYGEGRIAKNDPVTMKEALRNGLDPIGKRYGIYDATGIVEDPTVKPGRSWTAQVLAYVPGLFDKEKGEAVKRYIDKAGDVWHNKFLWDLVGDLQMGLYTTMRDKAIEAGHDPQTAGRMAAHFANRYAGALPIEAMSQGARTIANFLMFSRSFTLTNLGAFKDVVAGLPRDVQAQILRDRGIEALNQIQGTARRKAATMLAMDIVLSHVGTFMAAYAIAWAAGAAFQPPSENEPGKEDRFLIGYQKDGTAIYGRLPTGKVGEDLQDWVGSPVDVAHRKLSPFGHLVNGLWSNDKGFGQKIYDPYDTSAQGYAKNMARVAEFAMESVLPISPFKALSSLGSDKGETQTKIEQILLPMIGITVSKGAPGGPAMGQLYASRDEHEFQVGEKMPEIKEKIAAGDIHGATKMMTELGMSRSYQRFIIKTSKNPRARMSKSQMREFMGYAKPDERERMRGFIDADRARRAQPDEEDNSAPADQHSELTPQDFKAAVKSGTVQQFASAGGTWTREQAARAAQSAGMPGTAAILRSVSGPIVGSYQNSDGEPAFG